MINFMEIMRQWLLDEESKTMFILALLAIAMMLDMVTGTWAAKRNPDIEFVSKKGIDGIARKMWVLILAVFMIPVSILIPFGLGTVTLYTMHLGLLAYEIQSIFENVEKMGYNITPLKDFLNKLIIKK